MIWKMLFTMFKDLIDHLSSWVSMLSNIEISDVASFIGYAFLFLWSFYMVYILVMGIYRAHLQKKLNRFAFVLCLPGVIIGYTLDVIANLIFVPFVFLEFPREFLVTQRLQRHMLKAEEDRDWRYDLSKHICTYMLDVFDPTGSHCD